MTNPCVFCEIIGKTRDPELSVFEDAHVIAQISLHQKPGNTGHVLVIPKLHIPDIYQLPPDLDAPLMAALRLLANATKQTFSADGIQIRQNNESAAGQDVFHLHFHVIPRYLGDHVESQKYQEIALEVRRAQADRLKATLQNR